MFLKQFKILTFQKVILQAFKVILQVNFTSYKF